MTKVTGGKVRGRLVHRCCCSVRVWDSKCWRRCTGPVPPCVTPRGVWCREGADKTGGGRIHQSSCLYACRIGMKERREGGRERAEAGREHTRREKKGEGIFFLFFS